MIPNSSAWQANYNPTAWGLPPPASRPSIPYPEEIRAAAIQDTLRRHTANVRKTKTDLDDPSLHKDKDLTNGS